MKINLADYDLSDFILKEGIIGGDKCFLIFPKHIGVKWTKDNLIFRSSIWNVDGELISAGFKKFFNFSEQPELTYTPFSTTANGGVQIIEKIDGSTLIVSQYKNELIVRTRGTMDATKLDNGFEINYLKEKHPKAFEINSELSYLYEWVTPNNKIVLDYGEEPELYLIGIIEHENYTMASQFIIDEEANNILVKRPKTYSYNSIKDVLSDVPSWEGKEGVCIYCNKGQDIRKLKAEHYLSLHRMKSELGSFERVIDFWISHDMPEYNKAYQIIVDALDYEIAEQTKGSISRICDGWKEVKKIVDFMKKFVQDHKEIDQKTFAAKTFQKWGDTNRSGFVFSLRQGKELTKENYKKLLYQVLKK